MSEPLHPPPSTPDTAVTLPGELFARVRGHAERRGDTVAVAVKELIDLGLQTRFAEANPAVTAPPAAEGETPEARLVADMTAHLTELLRADPGLAFEYLATVCLEAGHREASLLLAMLRGVHAHGLTTAMWEHVQPWAREQMLALGAASGDA